MNVEDGTLGREYVSLVPYFGIEDAAEYGEYKTVEPGGLLVEAARLVATAAHAGQVDKGGAPYIEHPAFVADRVRELGGDEAAVAAGWLHDVVEDTRFTLDALAVVFPESVMGAVDALTRRDGEPYFDYVERARGNEAACLVKISDLEHNLDESRLGDGADVEATSARMERYREAMHRLIPGDDGGIA